MRRPAAGFTMVEVLVAVLLLAVGLVGALAMQAHAMRTRQESAMLTEALQAAASLADHIRANSAQSSAYLGYEFDAAAPQDAGAAAGCSDAPCDSAALVQRDLGEFRQQLLATMPSARALTCRDSSTAPDGRLQWPCSGSASAPIVIKVGWRSRYPDGSLGSGDGPGIALPVALASAGGAP